MKKILLALVICMFFSGCSRTDTTDSGLPPPEFFLRLEAVSKTRDYETIYRDRYTDVLYYRMETGYKLSLTPIMKADGTCLTYAEWQETSFQRPLKN